MPTHRMKHSLRCGLYSQVDTAFPGMYSAPPGEYPASPGVCPVCPDVCPVCPYVCPVCPGMCPVLPDVCWALPGELTPPWPIFPLQAQGSVGRSGD